MEWNGYWMTVVSHKRPENVPKIQRLIGQSVDATWYLGHQEWEAAYLQAGARAVVTSGALVESRNQTIEDAFARGLTCIQLSDDLQRIRLAVSKNNKESAPLTFTRAVQMLADAMALTGAKFAGAAPTNNAFYFNPNRPIGDNVFILADLMMIAPNPLRFDKKAELKEDYDYTLQHLTKYGKVARCNNILMTFQHRIAKGGASYRTEERERELIDYLLDKWPNNLRKNPKRHNEILLRWKR